jgi:hypothetical protein
MKRSVDGRVLPPVLAATTSTLKTIALSASQSATHAPRSLSAPPASWGIPYRAPRAGESAVMESERTERSVTMVTMSVWTDVPLTALLRTTLYASRAQKSD